MGTEADAAPDRYAGNDAPGGGSSYGLLERASAGDAAALEALLARHLAGLRTFVRLRAGRLLREKESSSDLVQSTCREVIEKCRRFRAGDEADFRHWLFRTAERKIVDRVRYYTADKRDAGREAASLDAPAADGALLAAYSSLHTPSRDAVAREEIERVERAMDRLSEDHREVILLARVVGLPHRRVAERMGRSEGAARALLFRALAELADDLARGEPG